MRANGFSLIELIFVIAIIAVINAVFIPKFSGIIDYAKTISAKSTARQIMIGIEEYFFIHQVYPDGSNVGIHQVISVLEDSNIMKTSPINPFTGSPFTAQDAGGRMLYNRESGTEYTLRLYGKNNETIILSYP